MTVGPHPYQFDVIVCGAGPAGLSAAYLLGREGLRVAVFEKRPTTTQLPKGQAVMASTAELFRQWGIWEPLLDKGWSTEASNGQGFYLRVIDGPVAAVRAIEGGHDDYVAKWSCYSPVYPRKIPASDYETALRRAAERLPGVTLHFSTPVVKAEHTTDGVLITVHDSATGHERRVSARYVIVCDGAHSLVRAQLGSGQDHGPAFTRQILTEFHADLDDTLGKDGFFHSFILDPRHAGWFGSKHPDTGVWRYSFKHDEDELPPLEVVRERIRGALGMPELAIRITRIHRFDYTTGLLRQWREGNVFFAGDAVHWHTPWGGLGMNSSIQDVHNLSWKLALVLKRSAGGELLASYQQERRAKALRTVKQATYNALHFQAIVESLRVGEPELLARGELSAEGRDFLRDRVNLHTANSILHVGYQLGTVYRSNAVLADESGAPAEEVVTYQESTAAGVRLPHAWLVNRQDERVSTRDLANGCFVLLVQGQTSEWLAAAQGCRTSTGLAPNFVSVCKEGTHQPADHKFSEVFGADEEMALLIRPDGYVGARFTGNTDKAAELQSILCRLLHRGDERGKSVEAAVPLAESVSA